MNTPETGILHFLSQADAVGHTLLAVLLLMSVGSWYVVLMKLWQAWQERQLAQQFLERFWAAPSLDEVARTLEQAPAHDSFTLMTQHALHARSQHKRHGATRLAEAGSLGDYLTRTLRKSIDEETARMENGLTLLASVGATAPFVGLFGTVWGVYRALVSIGSSGMVGLEQVAGPVGEALIMTGIGLGVAIPAVLAYNALTRRNRVLQARLDSFAYDLFNFMVSGEPVRTPATPHPELKLVAGQA